MPALKKKGCVCGYRYKKHFLYLFVFMFQLTKTRSFRYFDRHFLFNIKTKTQGTDYEDNPSLVTMDSDYEDKQQEDSTRDDDEENQFPLFKPT